MSSNYGDEDDFMNNLLADMDESLLRTPVKPAPSLTTRTCSKPIQRPNFSGPSNSQKAKTVVKRGLAVPVHTTPKFNPDFTPAKAPIDQNLLTTRLSAGKQVLVNDDIEDFYPLTPEEQLPRRVTIKTPAPPRAAPPHSPETITRAKVKRIERRENGMYPQVCVFAIDETTSEVLEVILKDDWESTRIRVGDIINVLGEFDELPRKTLVSDPEDSVLIPTRTITISSAKNTLVLHPDLLLPITAISNASICPRKPLLSMMVPTPTFPPSLIPLPSSETPGDNPTKGPGQDKSQEPLVWGNLLHEVVQDCLAAGTWSRSSISSAINRVLRDPASLSQLFRVDRSLKEAEDELRQRAGGIEGFARRFIRGAVPPEQKSKEEIEITGLHTVEEEIWSAAWGLKGKIDAAVEVVAEDPPLKAAGGAVGKSISAGSAPLPSSKATLNATARSKSSVESSRTAGKPEPAPSAFTKTRTKGIAKGLANAIKRGMVENSDATGTSWTIPFEIKTGRTVGGMEHRAQTMLYTLLIAERYGVQTPTGILYYTQKDEIIQVHPARNEIRGLMVGRNELAASIMHHRELKVSDASEPHTPTTPPTQPQTQLEATNFENDTFLPPPIDENYQCSKCYVKDACVLYRAAVEQMAPSPVSQLTDKASHLTASQKEFFAHWETLIALEEQDMVRFRKELWTMGAEEREKKGRCFARMIPGPGIKKDGKFVYEFTRAPKSEDPPEPVLDLTSPSTPEKDRKSPPIIDLTSSPVPQYQMGDRLEYSFGSVDSLLNGHIIKGDAVTISIDPGLLAFARGYVLEITTKTITVAFDQDLPLEGVAIRKHSKSKSGFAEFRIDKDDYSGGMAKLRSNLAALFYQPGDERRLRLVVDLMPPRFLTSNGDEKLPETRAKLLNPNQRAAVELVLRAQDYALVLGMPGTGKTTMVVELIKELVRRGKSVLLTSYTHSAVDTILLKLLEVEFDVLRLGNVDKVHIEARNFALGTKEIPETLEALERQLLRPPVVATTCLSIDHPLFARRTFDYCIVDEASQITLPSCLGPLRFAERFVLVGDHFQLPPLVKSKDAREGGMDISLFRRLSDAHPEAVVDLALQYRMNAEIMTLSNKLIYSDRLQCGSEKVATQVLHIPHPSVGLAWHISCGDGPNSQCWLNSLIDPSCKVRFVDTDGLPARNTVVGSLVQNEIEGQLVLQTIEALSRSGVQPTQIGVISPYRQQIKLLSHMLQERPEIEILTADRSQGRDKDCIIISMVRSNDDGNIGDLLKDWRRLNVSFTRARSKLIIFGSRGTLKCDNLLKQFFDLVDEKGWYMSLPKEAHLMHDFSKTHGKRTPFESPGDQQKIGATPVKRARVSSGVLRGRPLLQDIIIIDDD